MTTTNDDAIIEIEEIRKLTIEINAQHQINNANQQKIIDHQRQVIEFLLHAIWIAVNAPDDNGEQLADAYRLASSTSTMTETSEE